MNAFVSWVICTAVVVCCCSGASMVALTDNATLASAPELECYKIETPIATYFLEKTGAGLAAMIDRDGNDWINFSPEPGSRSSGENRGFPNAVHQQAGNYFHPLNQKTDASMTEVVYAGPDRVSMVATSGNGLWACQYDFYPTHCTFTMAKMPPGYHYWVLYEGTPGGQFDLSDWWLTSAVKGKQAMTVKHEGPIPHPSWIAFGDRRLERVLYLLHHESDNDPDEFYQMHQAMTVFGFGRSGYDKFLGSVPQQVSIGFLETTDWGEISSTMKNEVLTGGQKEQP